MDSKFRGNSKMEPGTDPLRNLCFTFHTSVAGVMQWTLPAESLSVGLFGVVDEAALHAAVEGVGVHAADKAAAGGVLVHAVAGVPQLGKCV